MKKKTNLRLMAVTGMVVLIACGSAWADLADGLIAHWPLDDGEGLAAVVLNGYAVVFLTD